MKKKNETVESISFCVRAICVVASIDRFWLRADKCGPIPLTAMHITYKSTCRTIYRYIYLLRADTPPHKWGRRKLACSFLHAFMYLCGRQLPALAKRKENGRKIYMKWWFECGKFIANIIDCETMMEMATTTTTKRLTKRNLFLFWESTRTMSDSFRVEWIHRNMCSCNDMRQTRLFYSLGAVDSRRECNTEIFAISPFEFNCRKAQSHLLGIFGTVSSDRIQIDVNAMWHCHRQLTFIFGANIKIDRRAHNAGWTNDGRMAKVMAINQSSIKYRFFVCFSAAVSIAALTPLQSSK